MNLLKHTVTSIDIIKNELSLFSYLANIISSVFTIGYLILVSLLGRGILWVNIPLVILATVNLTVFLIATKQKTKEAKKLRKGVKHFYGISKIILNAIPLGSVLYLLAFTNEDVNRIELVFLPLIILVWLAQIVLEILSLYVDSRITLFVDGLKMDLEPIIKIKNTLSGKDTAIDVSDSHRALLAEASERYIEEHKAKAEEDKENVTKENLAKRIVNTVGVIKDYIKK